MGAARRQRGSTERARRTVRITRDNLEPGCPQPPAVAAWDVDLGAVGGVRPAGDDPVDAEIVTAAAAACRCISARVDPGELTYEVFGDEQLARDIVDALPALAVL
jgi:hypothetical protein